MAEDPRLLQQELLRLFARAQEDPRLRSEIARARREFFGGGEPPAASDSPAQRIAEARFAEWYLLERESEVLGDVPGLALWPETFASLGLSASLAGVFLAERAQRNAAEVRDLQDGKLVELLQGDWMAMRPGDLLVGRLYRTEAGAWLPSAVSVIERNALAMAQAFQRDCGKLRLQRRLSQAELEQLWFAPRTGAEGPPEPFERLEAQLASYLAAAGKAEWPAAEICARLQQARTPGPVIGPLLDEIAFDTQADIEGLQRLLLQIWNWHHRKNVGPQAGAGAAPARTRGPGHAAEPPVRRPRPARTAAPAEMPAGGEPEPASEFRPLPGESLGQTLARRIREGLEAHEDIEAMFASVEQLLGERIDEGGESAGETGVQQAETPGSGPDAADAGDLEALVLEYAWENGTRPGPWLRQLVTQQREAPIDRTNVEYVTGSDLTRLLLHVYLQHPPPTRCAAVRDAHAELAGFYDWVAATQGYALGDRLQECRVAFLDHLDRVHAASMRLSHGAPRASDRSSDLWRVAGVLPHGVELQATAAQEPLLLRETGAGLAVGDLLLASVHGDRGEARLDGIVLVLPAAVEPLIA
jgi:hypothetical protein